MLEKSRIRPVFLLLSGIYGLGLYFFYFQYVPIVKPFQLILLPLLFSAFLLTVIKVEWGTLFFVFSFPLINNLPYFFGISEPIPHAPTALVLFLFYFWGWLIRTSLSEPKVYNKHPILRPMILAALLIFLSGIITFMRYANFCPFLSDYIYELVTNAKEVTAGGAIMSTVFFSLNYLSGFGFFFILFNIMQSQIWKKRIVLALCHSTFLSLSFGLFQHFFNRNLGNNPTSISNAFINATFKDALSLGAFIATTAVFFLGATIAFSGILRIFVFVVFTLSLYIIFFSGSKSGLLCLAIALLIFALLSSRLLIARIKSQSLPLRKVALVFFTAVLAASVIFLTLSVFKRDIIQDVSQSRTFSRLRAMKQDSLQEILRGRVDTLWKMALPMMQEYPLTGIGIGGFIIEVANYAKQHEINMQVPESAENYFLQIGSELGIIGLLLIFWIFWEIIKQMRRSYVSISFEDKNKYLIIGAIAGIIAFFVNIQVHTYIGSYEIKYTFWLLVAILCSFGGTLPEKKKPIISSKNFKIMSTVGLLLFGGIHLWNSTHSLSLHSRTERFGLEQNFGLYQLEKTPDGKKFRWTRGYGGVSLIINKPEISIPLHASHPDIKQHPVTVKIYLVKDLFKQKKLLGEINLRDSGWQTFTCSIPEEVGRKVIILIKSSRTWNPLKTFGSPDPRNLGAAIGTIQFKDTI